MAQPGYLKDVNGRQVSKAVDLFFPPTKKTIAWDGTFNLPTAGLAHPHHKDAANLDFIV